MAEGVSNPDGFPLWDKPSTYDLDYWIFHDAPNHQVDGKWMIFCNRIKPESDGLTKLDLTWKTLCDNHGVRHGGGQGGHGPPKEWNGGANNAFGPPNFLGK